MLTEHTARNYKTKNLNEQVNISTIICPVCSGSDISLIRAYRSHHAVFSGCSLFRCGSCEMVFAAPFPSASDLTAYNAGYFENAHGGKSTNKIAEAFFNGIAKLRYTYVLAYIRQHQITVNRVLEIGPGPGYFAKNWLAKHPGHRYVAVESDASCFHSLKETGVEIINGTEELECVDVVVISHVLEHVTDPSGFLKNATRHLRRGGLLFIEVPCQDWKHKPLDEPHLLFFEKKPLQQLLEAIGFEKISVNYYGQLISKLQQPRSLAERLYTKARNLLIRSGILWPFSVRQKGMEEIDSPSERAAVAPYQAHIESAEPAWWLRAAAIKG